MHAAGGGESQGSPRAGRRRRLYGLDPQWLSDVIGAIYDCVLDPAGWEDAIGTIADRFEFANATLAVLQIHQFTQNIVVNYRIDDEWVARNNDYIKDSMELWGGPERVENYPLDEPIVGSQVMRMSEWSQNRYYRDILAPRRITDSTVIGLAREPRLVGYVGFNRVDAGFIRAEEVQRLRLIAPHMRRAVTISNFFDLKAIEAQTFGSVLDGLQCAVLLVEEGLRIVHANRKADAMLDAGLVLHESRHRLKVRDEIAANALDAAVRLAATDEAALGHRGIAIPARGRQGAPVVMHVLPLVRRELRRGLMQRAVAAVFVLDGADASHSPTDAIATLFELTPTESRIFAGLCAGKTLDETAASLGIAKSTARTHLLRVFGKTGCKRQAELVALASKLSVNL